MKLVNDHINNNNDNRIEKHNLRFFTISSLRHELSPAHTFKWPGRSHVQITCNTSSAYHVQHVVLRVMRYEGTTQAIKFDSL